MADPGFQNEVNPILYPPADAVCQSAHRVR